MLRSPRVEPLPVLRIPRIRGPYRNRPPEEIEQVRELVDSGVKEINLVARDTTTLRGRPGGLFRPPATLIQAGPDRGRFLAPGFVRLSRPGFR